MMEMLVAAVAAFWFWVLVFPLLAVILFAPFWLVYRLIAGLLGAASARSENRQVVAREESPAT